MVNLVLLRAIKAKSEILEVRFDLVNIEAVAAEVVKSQFLSSRVNAAELPTF